MKKKTNCHLAKKIKKSKKELGAFIWYILEKNTKRKLKDGLTCYEMQRSNKYMNLNCEINYDLVHFNKIPNAKYLNELFWFLASNMGKEIKSVQSFQETKIICDQFDRQFAIKTKLIFLHI